MKKSTEQEKISVLIGRLDLFGKKKTKFIDEANALIVKILRNTNISCYQKSNFCRDITLKAGEYGYKLT